MAAVRPARTATRHRAASSAAKGTGPNQGDWRKNPAWLVTVWADAAQRLHNAAEESQHGNDLAQDEQSQRQHGNRQRGVEQRLHLVYCALVVNLRRLSETADPIFTAGGNKPDE